MNLPKKTFIVKYITKNSIKTLFFFKKKVYLDTNFMFATNANQRQLKLVKSTYIFKLFNFYIKN